MTEPRAAIKRMHAYIPGEQPKDARLIKLNTNENPYPPSPRVIEALQGLTSDLLRKYPNPSCETLRGVFALDLGVAPENVIVANGSDELLKLVVDAWVDAGEKVGYLWPTYSLYPVLTAKVGGVEVRLPWGTNGATQEQALRSAPDDLRVLFITSPNPPIGFAVPPGAVREVALALPQTLVVVDEAYIAYGGETAAGLVREGIANVLVTRTFSKSHSLAGMRIGFGVGSREVIESLNKIRDSYNVSVAAQAVALAAWQDREYTHSVVQRICNTRERLRAALIALGFDVPPSDGNFLFARGHDAPALFAALRERHICIRYFDTPELRDGLRITIGTDEEIDDLMRAVDEIFVSE